eukprot:6137081-Amphidinium_carterae.1
MNHKLADTLWPNIHHVQAPAIARSSQLHVLIRHSVTVCRRESYAHNIVYSERQLTLFDPLCERTKVSARRLGLVHSLQDLCNTRLVGPHSERLPSQVPRDCPAPAKCGQGSDVPCSNGQDHANEEPCHLAGCVLWGAKT